MIIGQDWGDVHYYTATRGLGRDIDQNPTRSTLEQLLRGIGLDVRLAHGIRPRGVRLFLTNAILCLKEGGMSAEVEEQWYKNCGPTFLRKQIEIVAPRVVVALGQMAYKSVLWGFGLKASPGPFRKAVEDEAGTSLPNGSRLLAVYHCGQRILNTHRPFKEQQGDWLCLVKVLGLQQNAIPAAVDVPMNGNAPST
jgi:hypothetical protein